jgi:hypothetical protein
MVAERMPMAHQLSLTVLSSKLMRPVAQENVVTRARHIPADCRPEDNNISNLEDGIGSSPFGADNRWQSPYCNLVHVTLTGANPAERPDPPRETTGRDLPPAPRRLVGSKRGDNSSRSSPKTPAAKPASVVPATIPITNPNTAETTGCQHASWKHGMLPTGPFQWRPQTKCRNLRSLGSTSLPPWSALRRPWSFLGSGRRPTEH